MSTVKTIKDVDENAWAEFKSIAARNKVKMGKLFESMLKDYNKQAEKKWDNILVHKKIISDNEASDMLSLVKDMRKEKGFRY